MKRIYGAFLVFCLAVFLLFTSVSTAPAAQAGPFYIGVFGGYVIPSDLEIENSADVSLKSSWAIGAKAGYIFPRVKWLAAELEYFYLAKQDIDQSGSSGDFSANNVMANLLVRYPEGKIHPYAGIGIGWSWGTFKATSSGNSIDESANAFAWQILAGVNFEITRDWSADVAYRYFSSKYDMGSDPSSDVTTKDNMFLLGINYHF
ncbi:MAG: outer membrane protein [Syntrophales bacterium]